MVYIGVFCRLVKLRFVCFSVRRGDEVSSHFGVFVSMLKADFLFPVFSILELCFLGICLYSFLVVVAAYRYIVVVGVAIL